MIKHHEMKFLKKNSVAEELISQLNLSLLFVFYFFASSKDIAGQSAWSKELLIETRSLEARWARLQACNPSALLDFVLRALWALRPCDSRNGAIKRMKSVVADALMQ